SHFRALLQSQFSEPPLLPAVRSSGKRNSTARNKNNTINFPVRSSSVIASGGLYPSFSDYSPPSRVLRNGVGYQFDGLSDISSTFQGMGFWTAPAYEMAG
ncbi:hypothetical protein LINPERPRIM_LOCUS40129, partial [Linum perenne]